MPPTTCACRPTARPTRCAASGSRSRRSPPTTAGSPTKACGRSVTSSTCGRSSAPRTGRRTRTSTRRFAAAVHAELGATDAPVFIQDYHLALVAPALRARRPDARTALFWHIPWPYPGPSAHLSVARASCSTGLLGNDLLAFQLERDRDNFLRAVEEELQADVEIESSRVTFDGRSSTVVVGPDWRRLRPHPGDGRRSGAAAGTAAAHGAAGPAGRDHRPRRRSARLHEGHSRAARRHRRADDAGPRTARPADLRADWRAVAVRARRATRRSRRRSTRRSPISTPGTPSAVARRSSPITRRR